MLGIVTSGILQMFIWGYELDTGRITSIGITDLLVGLLLLPLSLTGYSFFFYIWLLPDKEL